MDTPNDNTESVQEELRDLYFLTAIDVLEERALDGDEEAALFLEGFAARAEKLLDDIRGKRTSGN